MYRTILIVSSSESNFLDKLKNILKDINYEILYNYYEFNQLTKQIIYAVFKIETFYNIRNVLVKNLEKKFIKYPLTIYKLIGSIIKRKINKYYILSKLKNNKNYYFIRTEYTSTINNKILW